MYLSEIWTLQRTLTSILSIEQLNERKPSNRVLTTLSRNQLQQHGIGIEIYRLENHDCWHLEVVDEYSNSTVWDTAFPTDAEALDAAKRSIAEEGYESFIGPEGGEDKEEWL